MKIQAQMMNWLLSEMSNDEITVDNTKEYWKLCEAEDGCKLVTEMRVY